MKTEAKFCNQCGRALRPGLKFCERCGAPRRSESKSGGFRSAAVVAGLFLAGSIAWLTLNQNPEPSPQAETAQLSEPLVSTSKPSIPREPTTPPRPEQASQPVRQPETTPDRPDLPERPPVENETGDSHKKTVKTDSTINSPFSDFNGDDLDAIDGIEDIDLTRAETYLPYPRSLYQLYVSYPDGDEGLLKRFVGGETDYADIVMLEKAASKLYPNDEPTVTPYSFKTRDDGVYRGIGTYDADFQLYLPNKLALGSRWTSTLGSYEVIGFDGTVEVGEETFQGVLTVDHNSPEVGLRETIWFAPGHGEVLTKAGSNGPITCKLLSTEGLSEEELIEVGRGF